MSDAPPPNGPTPSAGPPDDPGRGGAEPAADGRAAAAAYEREDRKGLIAVVAVLLVLAVGGLVWWLLASGDDEETATTVATTTTTEATTTTEPTTTEAPTTTAEFRELSDGERATAIFPDPESSQRFDDPVAATLAFVTELVGFSDPLLGEFAQGDARSGEVEVRSTPDGPVTVVAVRQLGEASTWWVVAADTEEIVVDTPAPGEAVTSPMALAGRATAFEGTVEVRLHRDGQLEPIATAVVTGGAEGELQPYRGELEFTQPDQEWGALVLRTVSAADGRVDRATVQRIAFGGE